jgi:nucleoside-diphosphate-sugar epimerase
MSLNGTYLVTGGAGFIGSHIAAALAASGARVRAADRLSLAEAVPILLQSERRHEFA